MKRDVHSLFKHEKPLNRKTYVFRISKPKKPKEQGKVTRYVEISPEHDTQIKNYAIKAGCTYSHALSVMLTTEEAAIIEPPVIIDWKALYEKPALSYVISPFSIKPRKIKKQNANNSNATDPSKGSIP